jgi:DNA polymerase-3 subunit alpha
MAIEWTDIISFTTKAAEKLGPEYSTRLDFELKEIEKQAASDYFMQMIVDKKKYDTNKNGLVLPFLLKITSVDPIANGIKHVVNYEAEFPDIDSDMLPYARDPIKKFISEKFGHDKTCTVGNWNTLKLKQAILDSVRILGADPDRALALTKNLDDDAYDKMDLDDLMTNVEELRSYYDTNKEVIDLAMRLKGKIKSQGQHAGGVIISNVNLADTVPMSIINGKHVSQWTEGLASVQLSKFGLVKFDILGLKTMAYNVYTEQLIKATRDITIDWSSSDPTVEEPYFGYEILPDGSRVKILMNDEKAIAMADAIKTEAVFQFDTPVAKGVLSNGVRSFFDLVTYTAMARPGPMEMIPEWVARRDDPKQSWKKKEDPRVAELLAKTFGIICYQEQLTAFWMKFGGLTAPEAEKARKSVAKKKREEVIKLGPKIIANMVKNGFRDDPTEIDEEGKYPKSETYSAQGYWSRMVDFGRYCFNLSHAMAYGIVAYRALWLKAHYPPEFWASILTYCHPDKIPKYVSVAKSEDVNFKPLRTGMFSDKLVVDKELNVYPSLSMIKGIGENAAIQFSKDGGVCTGLDDFITKYGKNKSVMERLIKLGAFDDIEPNRKGLWHWYLYKYSSKNEETDKIRTEINKVLFDREWPAEKIKAERERQTLEFKKIYPKRKTPTKIAEWSPKIGPKYDYPAINDVIALTTDYVLKEKLMFEKEFLGVYWTDPMQLFEYDKDYNFENAKIEGDYYVDGIVEGFNDARTKSGKKFRNYNVSDGIETYAIKIWENSIMYQDDHVYKIGTGVRVPVQWNEKFHSFNLQRNCSVITLRNKSVTP